MLVCPGEMELFRGLNRLVDMNIDIDCTADKIPDLLKRLRRARGMSQLHLADEARVNVSVVHRAERGRDSKLSTWDKLFGGLGYRLLIDATELAEESADILTAESERRRQRREDGLCAGKRRW
jgi:transcriptional regulator with XRE-family HTH domain